MTIEEAVSTVRTGAGWTRLDRLSLIRVAGPQRVKFLHNLLSNDISGLTDGHSRLAALMNLKGQQVAWMRVLAEREALICEVPLEVRDTVVDTFTHYKVGAPVRFEKPEAAIFGVFGEGGAGILEALGFKEAPREIETFASVVAFEGTLRASRGRDLPGSGFTLQCELLGAEALEGQLCSQLGEPLAPQVLDALRIEEGIPWHGIDVTLENLLHETGQLDVYHSSSKGCYLGQEVVARLEGRGGNVNKLLRGFSCSQPSKPGEEITADNRSIGRVTTASLSPEFGPIAMGFVHRSHADPGAEVLIGSAPARVVALPFKH